MKTKVDQFTVKLARKQHPNDPKYSGVQCMESNTQWIKLMCDLTPEQIDALSNMTLCIDEPDAKALYDLIQPNDIIGAYLYKQGTASKLKVCKKLTKKQEPILRVEDLRNEEAKLDVSLKDLSVGLAMNYAEILYRDGKPYGVSEDEEISVTVIK